VRLLDDRDAVGLQCAAQPGDQLRVVLGRDGTRLHDRHAAAEPGVRLRHLQPDRAAAQDQQVLRRLSQVEQGVVREEWHVVQAGQVRYHGAAAGGDHDAAGGQAPGLRAHLDCEGIPRHEARRALQDRGAQAGVALDRIGRRQRGDRAMHVGLHAVPVDAGGGRLDAIPAGAAHGVGRVRRRQQRLAGHAADIQALAPHAPALDQRDAQAELRRDIGRGQPGRPGADHRQVEIPHASPLCAMASAKVL